MKTSAPKFKFFIVAAAIALVCLGALRLLGDCISFGILGHWVSFKAFDPMQELALPLLSLFFGFILGALAAGIVEAEKKEKIELGSKKSYIFITVGSVISYLVLKAWFF